MRLSLCVICGNEEAIICRLLDSFAPAFDELSITRAVGDSKADETVDRARSWCSSNAKGFVFSEYKNEPGPRLDHIDNFAAARNLAFSSATGDWLFWADCDDMMHEPERLRPLLVESDRDLIRFPYDVVGTNKRPMRERAIRRSAFGASNRWQFAVHENLRVDAATKIGESQFPVWIHQPKMAATINRRRNKAILARTLAHSAANYFYVHQEWFCEGNKRNAQRFGALALEFPDLDNSFRYETNLNLCRLADDPERALQYALAAHAVFPWCREALAMLALTCIDKRDVDRALFWAQLLDSTALPPQERLPWTHEPKWYGWAGNDLLSRCLRLAGKCDEADAVSLRLGSPVISLIHATRGRAGQAAQCRNQWLNLAANPERIEHIACVDSDDDQSVRLAGQFRHVVSNGKSCVAAWNQGAEIARGELLVQLSDDWVPVPGWDAKLLAEIESAGKTLTDELVIAVSDGHRDDDLLCMAICTRARWEKQGRELFAPEYESVFSDNEFSHRAWRDEVVIDARKRITFTHTHPAFNAAPMDATYAHNNQKARYERGAETFKQRNPDAFP